MDDGRFGRLPGLLASRPGETVRVADHKRWIGLLPHQPARTYAAMVRRLLRDSMVGNRRSRYIESGEGETLAFATEEPHALVRMTDKSADAAADATGE